MKFTMYIPYDTLQMCCTVQHNVDWASNSLLQHSMVLSPNFVIQSNNEILVEIGEIVNR